MKIFLTGVTGYIGGTIAASLVANGHSVRGLVRDRSKADAVSRFGITPIIGNLDDIEQLGMEAAASDITVNAADSRHYKAAEALVAGAKRSGAKIIHSSGIGLVSEDVEGMIAPSHYSDDSAEIKPGKHPVQQHMRSVENLFLEAARAGQAAAVVSNPMIYGIGSGLATQSIQIPLIRQKANEHGFVSVVGKGVNRWSAVHIDDVVDLYLRIIEANSASGFYFAESGAASFMEIGEAIASSLNIAARQTPLNEAAKIYGDMAARYLLGTNSVVKATRARLELGWSPKQPQVIEWINRG